MTAKPNAKCLQGFNVVSHSRTIKMAELLGWWLDFNDFNDLSDVDR